MFTLFKAVRLIGVLAVIFIVLQHFNPNIGNDLGNYAKEATAAFADKVTSHDVAGVTPPSYRNPDGSPVRWGTCTVSLVINSKGAPTGSVKLIKEAIAQVSRESGLKLKVLNTSDSQTPNNFNPQKEAPVLVAFGTPGTAGLGAGALASYTPWTKEENGIKTYISGRLVVDKTKYGDYPAKGVHSNYTVLLHELSHLVGLAHSDETHSLMSPSLSSATSVTKDVKKGYRTVVPEKCR